MSGKTIIKIDDLEVQVVQSKRAKRLNLTLKPLSPARISVPEGTPISFVREFLERKSAWLKRKTQELEFQVLAFNRSQANRTDDYRAYWDKAKSYIPKKVEEFAKKHSFKYNKIKIKNLRTRWGSCSEKNNLNFNLHLVRLPEELIDYVIMHELVHTVEKNHSKNFWDALERVLPGACLLDKQLKEYRLLIV